jgi:hypothetical protein
MRRAAPILLIAITATAANVRADDNPVWRNDRFTEAHEIFSQADRVEGAGSDLARIRKSLHAFSALSPADRGRVDQVERDLARITKALHAYADAHGGNAPASLVKLVPDYLSDVPRDPFATAESDADKSLLTFGKPAGERGYRYRGGVLHTWILRSVGLPTFPCRDGHGLSRDTAMWSGGIPILR